MIYTKDMIKQQMEHKEKIQKQLKFVSIPIFAILLIIATSVLFQRFISNATYIDILGHKSFVILTGSMEPKLKVGDVVIIKKVAQDSLKEGDIITFTEDNASQTVTHRITEIVEQDGKKLYRTKGDNNNSIDSDLVKYENIVGKLSFKISHLGLIINSIATTGGIALISIIIIINWSRSARKNDRILAREEIRKRCNVYKYGKDTKDINDTV